MGISIASLRVGHESYDGWDNKPDSAGGVSVCFDIKNTGTKTIKYISIGFIPYNTVNDPVSCTICEKSEQYVLCTGPINPNEWKKDVLFENAWYNYSITYVKISGAIIEYMDGSKEDIPASQIDMGTPSGCYIATAIYGSYDCPQVWTLRRYRDYVLAKTWYGKAFIYTYYIISPNFVKWFGHTTWFKKFGKSKLDNMITKLQSKGIKSTPYKDKNW